MKVTNNKFADIVGKWEIVDSNRSFFLNSKFPIFCVFRGDGILETVLDPDTKLKIRYEFDQQHDLLIIGNGRADEAQKTSGSFKVQWTQGSVKIIDSKGCFDCLVRV